MALMIRFIIAILFLLIPIEVRAQQITMPFGFGAYQNSDEWPTAHLQFHLVPANNMPNQPELGLLNPASGHIHHKCTFPFLGIILHPISVKCDFVMFHIDGYSGPVVAGSGITWDDTGTSTSPPLIGNPMGVVTIPFHMAVDPEFYRPFNLHGFVSATIRSHITLNNGNEFNASSTWPFYVLLDPNAPELVGGEEHNALFRANIEPSFPGDALWGSVIVETADIMPMMINVSNINPSFLRLLDRPWHFESFRGYNYGSLPDDGVVGCRTDIDLHNGSEGRPCTFSWFSSDELGSGLHRTAMFWKRDSNLANGFGPKHSAIAIIAFDVNVASGNEPPQVCTDPNAPNFNGPLPCQPPIVINPPPTEHVITPVFLRLLDQLKICDPIDGHCWVVN